MRHVFFYTEYGEDLPVPWTRWGLVATGPLCVDSKTLIADPTRLTHIDVAPASHLRRAVPSRERPVRLTAAEIGLRTLVKIWEPGMDRHDVQWVRLGAPGAQGIDQFPEVRVPSLTYYQATRNFAVQCHRLVRHRAERAAV